MTSLQAGKRALSFFVQVIMAPTTFTKDKGCTVIIHLLLLGILQPSVLVSGQSTSPTASSMPSYSSNASSTSATTNYTSTATAISNSTSMTSVATGNVTMTQPSNSTTVWSSMMTTNTTTTTTNVTTQLPTNPTTNNTSASTATTQSTNSTTSGSTATTQSANFTTSRSTATTQSTNSTTSGSTATTQSANSTTSGSTATTQSANSTTSGSTVSTQSANSTTSGVGSTTSTQPSGITSASGSTSSSSSMTSGAGSSNSMTSTSQSSNSTGGMSAMNGTAMPNSTSMSMIYCPSFMCNYSDCYTMYISQNTTSCDASAYCQLKRETDICYIASCSPTCAESCVNGSQTNCSVQCCNSTGCLNGSFASMMMTTTPVIPATTIATTAVTTMTATSPQTTANKGNKCHKGKCTGATCYTDLGKEPLQTCSSSEPHCQLKKETINSNVQWTAGCTTNCSEETPCKKSTNPPCHLECCNATLTSCLWLNGTLNVPSFATRGPHLNTELTASLLFLLAVALLL